MKRSGSRKRRRRSQLAFNFHEGLGFDYRQALQVVRPELAEADLKAARNPGQVAALTHQLDELRSRRAIASVTALQKKQQAERQR